MLLSGPAGTGKSRACLEKLLIQALKYPGMRGLIVRKTHISLTQTTLVTWREHVAKEAILRGYCQYYGGSTEKPAGYQFANGSFIAVGGMDKPMKVMSSEYDVAFVCEATELTVTDWESITSRLRNGIMPYQQIMADCNPHAPTHWLKRRCDAGVTKILYSHHKDNPRFFDDAEQPTEAGAAYLERLSRLTGIRRLRLLEGKWVGAEGVIYDEFDEAVHVVDRFDIPESWTRYWVIDFGYTNPFVCQWWAEDPDGKLYMYREIYYTRRTVFEHAAQIKSLVIDSAGRWTEPKPRDIVCDHDAEGRESLSKELGLGTRAAKKSVEDGIQVTHTRLSAIEPRMFFLRGSLVERDPELVKLDKPTCTVEEIPGYIWDIAEGKAPKEQPVKKDDHGCDAMRYLAMECQTGGLPRIRWA